MKHRYDQMTDTIKQEVASILLFKVNNPNLKNVAVTRIKMTRDLKLARIYYDVHGSEEEKDLVQKSLNRSRGFIRKELAPKLHMRFVPNIEFFFDDAQESLMRLDSLFQRL